MTDPKVVRFIEITFEEGDAEGPFVGEVTLWDDDTITIDTHECMPDIDGGGWKIASIVKVAEAVLELKHGGGTKQSDVDAAVRAAGECGD